MLGAAEGLDCNVDATSTRQPSDRRHHVLFVKIDDGVRAHAPGHRHANGIGLHGDYEPGALQAGPHRRAQPDRALGKYGHGIAELHAGRLRSGKAGGGNVREKHDLFVRQFGGNFGQVGLRMGYEQILGLSAIHRIAEFPAADGAAALRPLSAEAKFALSARSDGAHQHAFADEVAVYPGPTRGSRRPIRAR